MRDFIGSHSSVVHIWNILSGVWIQSRLLFIFCWVIFLVYFSLVQFFHWVCLINFWPLDWYYLVVFYHFHFLHYRLLVLHHQVFHQFCIVKCVHSFLLPLDRSLHHSLCCIFLALVYVMYGSFGSSSFCLYSTPTIQLLGWYINFSLFWILSPCIVCHKYMRSTALIITSVMSGSVIFPCQVTYSPVLKLIITCPTCLFTTGSRYMESMYLPHCVLEGLVSHRLEHKHQMLYISDFHNQAVIHALWHG